MKHLCCSRVFLLLFLFISALHSSITDKSAIVYLGEKISYPMVGVHDYIIVDPKQTNVYTHGFKVYNEKIYAKILIDRESSKKQLRKKTEKLLNQGFQNFFFDFQTPQNTETLKNFFSLLRSNDIYKNTKVILHLNDQQAMQKLITYVDAILVYDASTSKVDWNRFGMDVIDVETDNSKTVEEIQSLGYIPYIQAASINSYGVSSKKVFRREILTLISEKTYDRNVASAHLFGALPIEYMGYIQKLHNVEDGLPKIEEIDHYAGVIVWLGDVYEDSFEIFNWIKEVKKKEIPIVIAHGFGFQISSSMLYELGFDTNNGDLDAELKVVVKDPMMDYEIKVPASLEPLNIEAPKNSKELLTYADDSGNVSSYAAITPWGGYALGESFFVDIDGENLWVLDPFKFFKEALRLEDIPAPDPTTENGSRLFFTHVDGDGIMNAVEFDPELVSGEVLYSEILKKYHFPHSISVIGAEILPNGLYPELSKRLLQIAKNIYSLDNVEPATHTFSHPLVWGEIDNDELNDEYRLKPEGYEFSMEYEMKSMLDFIQTNLLPKESGKKANTVFWSGDCNPRIDAFESITKYDILNINGGETTIMNSAPWLTGIAPLGLQRDEYLQIYTGAQNENVYTNNWLGPFWGFKTVVQTFKLTNSPRRFKPIDVYYHIYSGSKKASLNALRYIFDWVLKQEDIMPIYTSKYIPRAMDFFTVSMAREDDKWLFSGMENLKTLRVDKERSGVDMDTSNSVIGVQHFEGHTYISLDQANEHVIKLQESQDKRESYLISANGKLIEHIKGEKNKRYLLRSEVPLEMKFHVADGCKIDTLPKFQGDEVIKGDFLHIKYKSNKEAIVNVRCK